MIHRSAVLAVSLLVAMAGCGGSDSTTVDRPAESVVADSPAPVPSGGVAQSAPAGGVDCDALKSAMGKMVVNTQIIVQLPSQAEVTTWPTGIGTIPEFGAQLDTLSALAPYGADVAETVAFFKGANEIVQRGYAGDAAAARELTDYLGTDASALLSKQVSFGVALDAAGC
jgi:hypothetical protein